MFTRNGKSAPPQLKRLVPLLVSAPAAILLLLAVAGLSGIGHRWVDLLAQFVAPAFIIATSLIVPGLLLRRFRVAAVYAVAALSLLIAAWPQWRGSDTLPRPGAPLVRLYSANLWAGNTEVDAIARSIAAADADIIILIELGDAPAARLDTVLAGYPHRVVTPRLDRSGGAARSVIAARYPLTAIADVADGLQDVAAVVRTPLGPVNVVGVHLTRPWPFQYQWGQISQVQALAGVRAGLTGPVIVAGDFNSVSTARIGRQVQAEAGLVPAPGWPGTWPSAVPAAVGLTIDQVYRSPDLAFTRRSLGRRTGSDHRPVITEFTLAAY
ncbi:endonuclease/exonuclease/phosphatase family protein [Brevundimonas sp.]|uniref:endonuclease/exonuclease/phosphatase family protein n=1 Tax=Brevundimonas sp. TaxID=1871086 RepID=UPI00248A167E|nr:endonuclease/exonuclease/phosphatase family protein [Brevundimonas sp.]MDI1281992.1 endonuclease/exonuclease/phosphatase family protein [Brevundimonas sp.]